MCISKNESLKQRINNFLKENKFKEFSDLTINSLVEEVNIYHQELIFQNEELIRVRNDLEVSEKKYIDLFNYAPIGYIILDEKGIVKKVNDTFLKLIEVSKFDIENKQFTHFISPESQDTFYLYFRELKKTLKNQTVNLFICKDPVLINEIEGKSNQKKLCVNLQSNIYIEDGNTYIKTSVLDITSEIEYQKKLEESEENYRNLFENANDGILVSDSKGNYINVNSSGAKMLKYTKEEILKKTILDIIPKEETQKSPLSYKNINQDDKIFEKRNLICGDGSLLPVEISAKKLKNGNLLEIVRDITDRINSEREIKALNQDLEKKIKERTFQLEQVNKDLESFAYSVSHDLRAPIRHIDGFTHLLKNSLNEDNSDRAEQYLEKIINSSKKMSLMIDELLHLSRLGRKNLDIISINLNKIINQIIEQYKSDYTDRKITFEVESLPEILGDSILLQLVFENLISNAIKFTSKKAEAFIKIGSFKENDKQVIYIKDNGAGFDMTYANKLFGAFQRLHTESEFPGIGIGLANVKQILTKHGWSIHGESEVDKGTTFYITI